MSDLLVLWSWEYDQDFVALMQRACDKQGVTCTCIGPDIFEGDGANDRLTAYLENKPAHRWLLDRVWDEDNLSHISMISGFVQNQLNPYTDAKRAWNKPSSHFHLIAKGLYVPYMLVLPSEKAQATLPEIDLSKLGARFSVKGAHSGGSGVLKPHSTLDEINQLRKAWQDDETIVQTWVEPVAFGARRAWFRAFYCCGEVFICWADDQTHIQTPLSREDEQRWRLGHLRDQMCMIAEVCKLNLFSSELALDQQQGWLVVDYVNDPCDFRLKSRAGNGVPDEIVGEITQRLACWVGADGGLCA
jgi:hypothetical protein